jgi:hypothetical protein
MSPDKPTRDAATSAEDPREMYDARAGAKEANDAAPEDGREEKGSAESSRRNPPHPTEGAEAGRVQSKERAPGDVPVLPANAQGTDKVSTEEHDQPIDETSMYDGRRDENKDTPPSTR